MHRMIIFDDGRGQFGPMTDLRAAFEVRTGMYTNAARLAALRPRTLAGYWTPDRVRALVAERANAPVNVLPDEEVLYLANGRWATPDADLRLDVGEALLEHTTEHVVAATLRRADAEYFLTTGELHERIRTRTTDERVLYRHPWDVIAMMKQTIRADVAMTRINDGKILPESVYCVDGDVIEAHQTAIIFPGVVLDATQGPIVIHDHAVIRPNAVICGPAAIGPHATVTDGALIKPNTVIGPWCKVGGEVGSTIFQGFANKTHDGHLGDSWVGKWANFGAGTTNSNLLNTYGDVPMRIEPDGPRQRTGLQFLGAIVGDHVKTAISTRLMTGSVLGTGAMIACTAPPPTTVRRFAWLTDDGERPYRLDKFIDVMTTVMARRDRTPGKAYLAAIEALHGQYAAATTRSA